MTLVAGKRVFFLFVFFIIDMATWFVRDATIFSNVILQHAIEFLCSIILKAGSYLEINKWEC